MSENQAHADELQPGWEASHSLTAEGCVGLSRAVTDSQDTETAAGAKRGFKQKQILRSFTVGQGRISMTSSSPPQSTGGPAITSASSQ